VIHLLNAGLTALLTVFGIILYSLGFGRLLIKLRRKSPRVLMYHACEPEESDFTRGLSINTPPSRFKEQLNFISKYYRIVTLEDLCREDIPERAVVITFDDGYRSVYEHAFPLLKAHGFHATVFLVADVVDNGGVIWLNALSWYLSRDPSKARDLISERLGCSRTAPWDRFLDSLIADYDPVVVTNVLEELETKLGGSASRVARQERLYLGESEIAEMARHGVTYGNHTVSHPNLRRLSIDARRGELTIAKQSLLAIPGSIDALAYPFGIHDEVTRALAVELGYSMLLEVKGNNQPLDLLHIARLNVTSDSPGMLFAKMEVVYPFKAFLKHIISHLT